jgi:hypothetical protein
MRAELNLNSEPRRVRGSDLTPGLTVRLVHSGERYRTVLDERLLKLISLDREDKTPRFLFRFGVDPIFEIIEE